MKFSEIIDQASALLQRKGRMTYRALKLEFALDDEQLDVLREELIDGQELAVDKDGKMLVWTGKGSPESSVQSLASSIPSLQQSVAPRRPTLNPRPSSYTPPHLAERIRAEQATMEARGATDGERKTITALFADIQDSTALIEDLDPEAARRLLDPALQLMMDAVHRYEGFVVQPTGDGIFALFGAPLAHEDHPQRALYAALLMQQESKRYAERLRREQGLNLQIRVGVNTGEVVLRSIRKDDLHTDYTPVGHSIHLAARLESLASGGAVVISEGTYKLIEGYFECQALGEAKVKGVTAPIPIYEVRGVGPLRTRLQVAARRGFTRFVGRHSEMEQLKRALDRAKAGHGQIVGVMGEPGLGKSRLFYEFKLASQGGALVLEAYSVSYGKASPYLPVIELLKSYFQIQPHDDERTRREKVGGKVLMLDRHLEETLPYLFALLSIDDPTSSLPQMDPQIRRQRTFDALKKLFVRESLNQPLILIFEDLHWIDTETQGFLDTLSESMASARLLLLMNYRPEYRSAWGQKTYYTQLRLAPLGTEEAGELLTALLGSDGSLTAVKRLILAKTEGTPFFMEEVVQTLAEEGVLSGERGNYRLEQAPTELHISPTVQGVLAARIDRLTPDEKDLLQQLAVIGREFPLSLLRYVLPQPEEELYHLLASLQRKEFLYEQPAFPEVEYMFKHALTQEVAYGTVLQERRKALHEKTAQAIERLYAGRLEEHYSDLARHYSRSGKTEKAIEYLHLAGQQAVQRSANEEAITHLTTALELLKTLPATAQRAQQELTLLIALGSPLRASKGFAAPEVEMVYTRAQELCEQIGDLPQRFSALRGLWGIYFSRGQSRLTQELAEQLLHLAERAQDAAFLPEAHRVMGVAAFAFGELTSARVHLEQGIALYDPQCQPSLSFLSPFDPGVDCRAWESEVLWCLGYPDQALQRSQEALARAYALPERFTLASALSHAATLHRFRGELQLTQRHAETLRTLATEHGFPLFSAQGATLQGWTLAEQGQTEAGLAQIRQGLATLRDMGLESMRITWPYHLALLAEAYGKAGQIEEGLTTLAEALAIVDKTRGRRDEAELYRLRGELALQQLKIKNAKLTMTETPHQAADPQAEAEAEVCFLKAIEIARKQQAKSLELRAVMSLSRLWQQQGKKQEAHELLSAIYNWFTEGFDTKDLQEAKALIEELNIESSGR